MIRLLLESGSVPVDLSDFWITHVSGGLDTLEFDISPKHALYQFMVEEQVLEYKDNRYLIKSINERKSISTISCGLDLDFLRERMYLNYQSETKSLYDVLAKHLPKGWIVEGADLSTARRTIKMDSATDYDVIMQAMNTYGVVYEWHTLLKKLVVIKQDLIQPKGVYFTDELNLKNVNFKGQSNDFITRLYPFGKDQLSIASANGGKPYVDDHTYSDRIVAGVWVDERYTSAENLRDDAIERLKRLAVPVRSYECSLLDLAKVKQEYAFLEFRLYDIVTLVDPQRRTRIDHRIVQYKEYPLHPEKNVVTLSTVAAKITTKIYQIKNDLQDEIQVDREIIRTVEKDAEAIAQRIKETYTKGETDAVISSVIKQSKDSIILEVSESYATKAQTVISTATYYAQGTSPTEAPEAGWSANAPPREEGKYIWQRTVTTYGNGDVLRSDPVCLSGADGKDGADAVLLQVISSNGQMFKNSAVSTTLAVNIIVGGTLIASSREMYEYFGPDAYIVWLQKKFGETEFTQIDGADPRISDNGFLFTLNSADVQLQTVYNCELYY